MHCKCLTRSRRLPPHNPIPMPSHVVIRIVSYLKIILKIAAWNLIVIALVELAIASLLYRNTDRFLQSATRTQGTVKKFLDRPDRYTNKIYYPVYAYQDGQGNEYETYSSASSYPIAYQIGDKVTMLYLPAHPNDATPDTFLEIWLWPILVACFGFLKLVGGLSILLFFYIVKRGRKRKAVAQEQQTGAPAAASLPAVERSYKIAFKGEEIGEFPITAIRNMLRGGMISVRDYYFDPDTNEWKPLEQLREPGA